MANIISFETNKDFNFTECLRFLRRSDLECLFHTTEKEVFQALKIDKKFFLIRIFFQEKKLQIAVSGAKPNARQLEEIKNYVADWLDLETDLKPFYRIAKNDPLLKSPCTKYRGLRLIGVPSLVEAISWAIIGQQINLTFAYTLKKRLVEHFGAHTIFDGIKYLVFPTPEKLASLQVEDLRPLQFSRSKASYLIGVAQALADGRLSKEQLMDLDYEVAKAELIELKGVGNWTADYVLMKCLRHRDAFPIADVGLHNAIKFQLGLNQKPSLEEIEKMSANWIGWRSYATFYLWHSLLDV